jgi:hypothetical protein
MEETDLQAFIDLYKKLGIDINPLVYESEILIRLCVDDTNWLPNEATSHEKINGDTGAYTTIHFNKDGKFVSQSLWHSY